MLEPGDVVIVDYPGAAKTKRRPGLVVSTVLHHSTSPDVVVAVLTGNTAAATRPTDYVLTDGAAAGLVKPTAFRAYFETLEQWEVHRVIGKLSAVDWAEVQVRLRLALAVM